MSELLLVTADRLDVHNLCARTLRTRVLSIVLLAHVRKSLIGFVALLVWAAHARCSRATLLSKNSLALIRFAAVSIKMDGDRAAADRSDEQQTTIEGERLIEERSSLSAFRYSFDRSPAIDRFPYFKMLLSDRYALHIPYTHQLMTIAY